MRRAVLGTAVALAAALATGQTVAQRTAATPEPPTMVETCLRAAAAAHRVDPVLLVILLQVEGGSLGRTSPNSNGTHDIGPMQVNTIWVRRMAERWRTTPEAAFRALRDSFCANVEAGAWILRLGLDDSGDDFWRGVGFYHSRTPEHRERYLRAVADRAQRLAAAATREPAGPSVGR